jgi:hypothetical protein
LLSDENPEYVDSGDSADGDGAPKYDSVGIEEGLRIYGKENMNGDLRGNPLKIT